MHILGHVLIAVTFLVSFVWSSVYVGLPFYVEHISRVDSAATVAWTGWILGITSLVSVASSPLWARLASHRDPRTVFVVVQVLQALGFLAAAFAASLLELFTARCLLGVVGVTSTLAFMVTGQEAEPAARRRQVALIQSANTVGQVLAPLIGGVAVARVGFRLSFVLGGLILAGCAALVQWGMAPGRRLEGVRVARSRRPPVQLLVMTSLVVLIGAAHDAFLVAVLPTVLPRFGVAPDRLVETAGFLLFVSGAMAAIGGLAAPRLTSEVPPRRLLPILLAGSSLGVLAFGAASWLWLFTSLRIVQSLCLAPLFPVMVARMVRLGGGETIGILNAARAGGSFLGPVVATTVLAWAPPAVVYAVLGVGGLAAVPVARW